MVITMQQLKTQPGRIFGRVNKGQEMAISYKGKICAKIVPLNVKLTDNDDELFGMWKDRDDIGDASQYVRKIRKMRKLC